MEPIWEVGIQPAPVVFCQEGQFGEGMIAFGRPRGRTIFVLPKNLFFSTSRPTTRPRRC
ncbi:MAG: hypothetical protein M0C28_41210 [Candidatus Moduliflexus flocculans]|nr:hypothetical protein [Candidatus Moduliflexus flocculans]